MLFLKLPLLPHPPFSPKITLYRLVLIQNCEAIPLSDFASQDQVVQESGLEVLVNLLAVENPESQLLVRQALEDFLGDPLLILFDEILELSYQVFFAFLLLLLSLRFRSLFLGLFEFTLRILETLRGPQPLD